MLVNGDCFVVVLTWSGFNVYCLLHFVGCYLFYFVFNGCVFVVACARLRLVVLHVLCVVCVLVICDHCLTCVCDSLLGFSCVLIVRRF